MIVIFKVVLRAGSNAGGNFQNTDVTFPQINMDLRSGDGLLEIEYLDLANSKFEDSNTRGFFVKDVTKHQDGSVASTTYMAETITQNHVFRIGELKIHMYFI